MTLQAWEKRRSWCEICYFTFTNIGIWHYSSVVMPFLFIPNKTAYLKKFVDKFHLIKIIKILIIFWCFFLLRCFIFIDYSSCLKYIIIKSFSLHTFMCNLWKIIIFLHIYNHFQISLKCCKFSLLFFILFLCLYKICIKIWVIIKKIMNLIWTTIYIICRYPFNCFVLYCKCNLSVFILFLIYIMHIFCTVMNILKWSLLFLSHNPQILWIYDTFKLKILWKLNIHIGRWFICIFFNTPVF